MADGIYVSMSGAAARVEQLDAISDNLANSQTAGFKASRPTFEAFLPEEARGQLGYTAATGAGVDLRPGATMVTGQTGDVVPEGGAFLAVSSGDGAMSYTRNGRMVTDANSRLSVLGRPVLGADGQPIVIPEGSPWSIDGRGVVTANGEEVGRLGLFQLTGAVERIGDSLYSTGVSGQAMAVDGRVRTGEIELSNANPLETAVQMIGAQRSFDTSMQALQTYKQLDSRATELGKTR
jgi:flagellar basal-body rod protein FlgF